MAKNVVRDTGRTTKGENCLCWEYLAKERNNLKPHYISQLEENNHEKQYVEERQCYLTTSGVIHTVGYRLESACLASPANFIYGRVKANVLSHVTFMPVLLRPVNNFLG